MVDVQVRLKLGNKFVIEERSVGSENLVIEREGGASIGRGGLAVLGGLSFDKVTDTGTEDAIITAAETVETNDNDSSIPIVAAIKKYAKQNLVPKSYPRLIKDTIGLTNIEMISINATFHYANPRIFLMAKMALGVIRPTLKEPQLQEATGVLKLSKAYLVDEVVLDGRDDSCCTKRVNGVAAKLYAMAVFCISLIRPGWLRKMINVCKCQVFWRMKLELFHLMG